VFGVVEESRQAAQLARVSGLAGVKSCWSLVLRIEQDGKLWDSLAAAGYCFESECIDVVCAVQHRSSILDTNCVEPVEKTLTDFASTTLIMPAQLNWASKGQT
jgi:hypothetical protein